MAYRTHSELSFLTSGKVEQPPEAQSLMRLRVLPGNLRRSSPMHANSRSRVLNYVPAKTPSKIR